MTVEAYVDFVMSRWKIPSGLTEELYITTALAGEVGEVCNNVKKFHRNSSDPGFAACQNVGELKLELGDVFYYFMRLAAYNGWTLEEIMQANVDKLTERYGNK